MKKLIIIISILLYGVLSYAQLPAPTAHQTLNNGEQMGVFRGKLNTNGINIVNYLSLVRDTINDFSDRIKLLELGGTGGGSSYIFGNGLTESLGTVSLGGILTSNSTITTGLLNSLSIQTASATPSSGVRSAFTVGGTQSLLSSYTYSTSAISTGGGLSLNPVTGFSLIGRLGTKYSNFKHNSLGPLIESDISSSSDYRTVNLTPNGLIYGGDYSGSYTDRSLVDKGYVTSLFTGSTDNLSLDTLKFNNTGIHANAFITATTGSSTRTWFRFGSPGGHGFFSIEHCLNSTRTYVGDGIALNPQYSTIWTDGTFIPKEGNLYYNKEWPASLNDRLLVYDGAAWDTIAYLSDLYGLYTSFNGDTLSIENLEVNDSIYYLGYGLPAGSVWFTNTSTGAIDTAHTEPAYVGWEMEDLPTLEEYEADVKMINGHMERRVWYIDYETKELKSQYGWDGLGMMNTQSAYMIYHEITVRWMFEQNKKIAELERRSREEGKAPLWRTIASIIIFIMFMILLAKQHIRLAEIESECINNRK